MTVSPTALAIPVVAGICTWSAYHPSSQMFGPTRRKTGQDRTLALTFDDGPNPAATPQLLDLLDRYDARATFFLIGRYVRHALSLLPRLRERPCSESHRHAPEPVAIATQILTSLRGARAAILRRPDSGDNHAPAVWNPWSAACGRPGGETRPPIMWSKAAKTGCPITCTADSAVAGGPGSDTVLLHDGPHGAPVAIASRLSTRSALASALEGAETRLRFCASYSLRVTDTWKDSAGRRCTFQPL